jgi:hypothetical protein
MYSHIELVTEIGKGIIKGYYSLKDNGEKEFLETYKYQGKVDDTQIGGRNEDINLLEDSEKYNGLLVKNGILEEELKTVFYLDGSVDEEGKYNGGYSNKEG